MANLRIAKLNPARLDRLDQAEGHSVILPEQDVSGVLFWREGRWRVVWDDTGSECNYMASIHGGWLVIAPPAPRETAPGIWYETQRAIALERHKRARPASDKWEGYRG